MKRMILLILVLINLISIVNAQPGSDCFYTHDHTGCDIPACQEIVCGMDPWCCNNNWDGICVSEAVEFCDEEPPQPNGEVPEFSSIGAGLALLGAGFYISQKRKKN